MNDLTKRQTTEAAIPASNPFEAYGNAVSQRTIVGDLLKFSKGEYLAGQNDEEIAEGTELIANMDQLLVGWVKWVGGRPEEQQMGLVAQGHVLPSRKTLGDLDSKEWEYGPDNQPRDPWQMTNYLVMKQPDGDRLFTFATSSRGGLNAIGELCKHYGKQMRQRPDEFPIVALNIDSYRHSNKEFGKIFVPKLDIVGWASKAEFEAALAAEEKAGQEAEPEKPAPAAKPPNGRAKPAQAAATRF